MVVSSILYVKMRVDCVLRLCVLEFICKNETRHVLSWRVFELICKNETGHLLSGCVLVNINRHKSSQSFSKYYQIFQ